MNLDDAAKQLKEISEKDYTARLADVMGRYEATQTDAIAIEDGPELVHMPSQTSALQPGTYNVKFNADGTSEWTPINTYGDAPWRYAPMPTEEQLTESLRNWKPTITFAPVPELTEERIREIVAETIKKVLYPDTEGLVTHQHRRIRQWDENGDEWRGVLYKVEKESEM